MVDLLVCSNRFFHSYIFIFIVGTHIRELKMEKKKQVLYAFLILK